MKTQIVIEQVSITGQGQTKHFEIRIPDNVIQINGIEWSVRMEQAIILQDPTLYSDEILEQFKVADIRLQGAKEHTWFYAGIIKDSIRLQFDTDFLTENLRMNMPYDYHGKRDKEILSIQPNTTRIKGFVKDSIAKYFNQNLKYTVTICLHVELN